MDAKEIIRRVGAVEAGSEIKEVPEKKWKFLGVDIGALIGILITIVVGVNLMPAIIDAGKEVEEEGGAVAGLIGILPVVYAAVVIIGAVAYIYAGRKEKYEEVEELSGADEIRQLQKRKRKHLIYVG